MNYYGNFNWCSNSFIDEMKTKYHFVGGIKDKFSTSDIFDIDQ